MIKINGIPTELASPISIADYLEEEGYKASQVAVEYNEEIIPKSDYADTMLENSGILEIVMFMGGGSR